jgi:beta-lactam-binding protein with PASTA domain
MRLLRPLLPLFSMVLFLLSFYLTLNFSLSRQEAVECPRIEGRSLDEARRILENVGLSLSVSRFERKEDLPNGTVLVQDPKEGTTIKKGRRVHAIVSMGPKVVACPEVLGMRLEEAESLLKQKGLTVGKVVYVPSKHIGVVLAQSPHPYNPQREGLGVTLFVGSQETEYYILPDIHLDDLEAFQAELKEKGITYRTLFERDENCGIIPTIELSGGKGKFISTKEELVIKVCTRR